MTPDEWRRLKGLLASALEVKPADRTALLDRACAGDPQLRRQAESLLSAEDLAASFLEAPALEAAAELLEELSEKPSDKKTLAPGTHLGPYEIVALLGAGGMGDVYRARDARLHRDVAVKVLPGSLAADPARLSRFEREARAASALSDPHIVAVFDVGREGSVPYFVSELVEGETLRALLTAGRLPLPKAIELAEQIATGLAAAHEHGVVHRDLKPENILISRSGLVKIGDFGLAKLSEPTEPLKHGGMADIASTAAGLVMGTIGYMAPEQIQGGIVDARSDIFAFGCLLYEMCAGRRAFLGLSPMETMASVLRDDPAPASKVDPAVNPAIDRLIFRCLEKDPDQRFQNARDLTVALRAASADLSGVGSPLRSTGPIDSTASPFLYSGMRESTRVALCWAQVSAAAVVTLLAVAADVTAPTLGIVWRYGTDIVSEVLPGSPAERAGVKSRDLVVAVDGEAAASDYPLLYNARAGRAVSVEVERMGKRELFRVIPETNMASWNRALSAGGSRVVGALAGYLRAPANLLMLAVGILLLALRPHLRTARIAALALTFRTAGNDLGNAPGFGALMGSWPAPLSFAVHAWDLLCLSFFFSLCVLFALVFPEPLPFLRRRPVLQLLPFLAALPLLAAKTVGTLRDLDPDARAALPAISDELVYQIAGPTLLLAALAIMVWRLKRTEDRNERRRSLLIFLSLAPGVAGLLLVVLTTRLGASVGARNTAVLFQWLGMSASGVIFVYTILRHRLFDIRLLVRKSIRYALARGTLLAVLTLPGIALVVFLYDHRRESLADLLSGRPALYVSLLLLLFFVLRYRRGLLDGVDRRFFRERYDARQTLHRVLSMIRPETDPGTLASVALSEIERALHPVHVSLWSLTRSGEEYRAGTAFGRPLVSVRLPRTAALTALISSDDNPLDLDSPDQRKLLRRLPEPERVWMGSTDARLIAPLLVEKRLVGFLLLGERLSEEPYDAEDRDLLRAIASQLALTLDYARLKSSPLQM